MLLAVLAGQQGGAAPRAHRCGAEGVAEQHPLVGQVLDVGRGDLVAVGLDPPPRVVGMDVEMFGATIISTIPSEKMGM